MRLDIVFVSVCMVLIAGSTGAVAYSALGLGASSAMLTAMAVLALLIVYNLLSARFAVRPAPASPPGDLARIIDPARQEAARQEALRQEALRQEAMRQDTMRQDTARQIAQIERGLATLERRVDGTIERTRAATEPLTAEVGELGSLIRQVAETLAEHERKLSVLELAELERAEITPPRRKPEPPPAPPPPAAAAPPPEPPPAPIAPAPPPAPKANPIDAMAATIRSAIEANRVDLYLQPMVTLPQRKIRYYEALSRLRSDKGDVVLATDFLGPADVHGLMSKIDNLVIFRCVQVIRRLLAKNREIGLFCNVSASTLADGSVFPQLLDFLEENRTIAPSVVFEFPQSVITASGPIELESLAALAERGYRFSLDNVTDLRFEPRELLTRGFRFVKVRADVLLKRVAVPSDIDPADLADLLGRFGIDLIAERIESEGMVVDLLDCGVRFGQGFVFSPPRPVRAEALQGVGERGELTAREPVEEAPPAPPAAPARAPAAAGEAGAARRTSGLSQIARRI
jgi:cyclic-di-GMP phosphodiesterase TipF (flagellum assembly factor)